MILCNSISRNVARGTYLNKGESIRNYCVDAAFHKCPNVCLVLYINFLKLSQKADQLWQLAVLNAIDAHSKHSQCREMSFEVRVVNSFPLKTHHFYS